MNIIENDPLRVLIKSSDYVAGVNAQKKRYKKPDPHAPYKGQFVIMYKGKIIIPLQELRYGKPPVRLGFMSYESCEKWGLWNYKGKHDGWGVVKL